MRLTRRNAILIVTLLGASLLAGTTAARAQAPAAPKAAPTSKQMADRDREAKRLFISGNYREAITALTELYNDSGNPIYLRNIARCHQRLRDPDRAIASFEEYLLRSKDISTAEREEVKGFIRDMEELKRREAESRGRTQAPPAAPATTIPTAPATGAVPAPAPGAPLAAASPPPAVPPGSDPAPPAEPMIAASDTPPATTGSWQRKAGVIALIGAGALAVGGGAVLTASWLNYNTGRDQGCGTTRDCPEREDKIKTRNMLAAGMLIGAAVAGAAGGTLFLIAPTAGGHAGAPTGLTVATRGSF